MAFSDATKLAVKRKSHFCCCLCHLIGVEVHHIIPQADKGEDTEENAAPLCPSCHETYGANPQKRKFIREARDLWYEICAKRYATDPDRLNEIAELLKHAVTKAEFDDAISKITNLMRAVAAKEERPVKDRAEEVAWLGSIGVSANRHCKSCGTRIGLCLSIGEQRGCPTCGAPW
jgi:hypothetical protein